MKKFFTEIKEIVEDFDTTMWLGFLSIALAGVSIVLSIASMII